MSCYVSTQIAQHAEDEGMKDLRDEEVARVAATYFDSMKADPGWLIEAWGEAMAEVDLGTRPGNEDTSFAKSLDQFIGQHNRGQMAKDMMENPQQFALDLRALALDYLERRAMDRAEDAVPDHPYTKREQRINAMAEDAA